LPTSFSDVIRNARTRSPVAFPSGATSYGRRKRIPLPVIIGGSKIDYSAPAARYW
jgi:hypothetical protein